MTELPSAEPHANQSANDVLEAKQRLLDYSQRRSGPAIYQRHPALVAGAALLLGVVVVRVPTARNMVRAGALFALRELGASIAKSVTTRL